MKFDYAQPEVALGRKTQQRAQEFPTAPGTVNSVAEFNQVTSLDTPEQDKGGRFAGERLASYLYKPGEMERTNGWMQAFERGNLLENMNYKRNIMESNQMMAPEPPMEEGVE